MGPLTTGTRADSATWLQWALEEYAREMEAFNGTQFNAAFLKTFKERWNGEGKWDVKAAVQALHMEPADSVGFTIRMEDIGRQCHIMTCKQTEMNFNRDKMK